MRIRKATVKIIRLIVCTAIFIATLEYLSKNNSISKLSEKPSLPITKKTNDDLRYLNKGQVKLGKGINIGNSLESPKGINWGVEFKTEYFDYVKDAGFDTVRLPVRFSAYADDVTYMLDIGFMDEIDEYIQYALKIGLNLILDFHHFEEIMFEPTISKNMFLSIWKQLSTRYKNYPNTLIFEVLNEPKDQLYGQLLNDFLDEAIKTIRETNPDRLLLVGGDNYNSIQGLESLVLPEDKNIIATFHYYTPNEFTFQGNAYHKGYEHLNSIEWTGTEEEMSLLRNDFLKVKNWADMNGFQVYLGEFGVVKTVPIHYRKAWIKAVTDLADEYGFSWCYWELASHFGIFDSAKSEWDTDILQILTDR